MEKIDLTLLSNADIAKHWNNLAAAFEGKKLIGTPVGFFLLSKETDRRNLQLAQDRFGKIILQPKSIMDTKPTNCSKCGDEGWLYGRNGSVKKCNCKPVKQTA